MEVKTPTRGDVAALQKAAEDALETSYPRYSGFEVVAAVERIDGRIYGGANVEIVNLSLTKHAEEAAAMAAIADGALQLGDKWLSAVFTRGAPPCGSCRQFLWEWAMPDAVCLIEEAGVVSQVRLSDLLPVPFEPSILADRRQNQ
jgi:cytidine deaminase